MSKRGSKRPMLCSAQQQNFQDNYDPKRASERNHYAAFGHCAGKFVRIIYKMLTDNMIFHLE